MRVREMLSSHPEAAGVVNDALVQCIEACFDCAQVCMSCADACLAEHRSAELTRCIRLDLDCADACATTGSVQSKAPPISKARKRAWINSARFISMCVTALETSTSTFLANSLELFRRNHGNG